MGCTWVANLACGMGVSLIFSIFERLKCVINPI